MPIYAYRCESCGHAKDVLRKISDPLLTLCPSCGAESFKKQLTSAGFQLKGSGWYVTDFRGGANATGAPAEAGAPGAEVGKDGAPATQTPADNKPSDKPAGKPATTPAATETPAKPAPAAAPASAPAAGGK